MNIHPIIVHFPIALLTLYGLFELVRFKKISTHPFWFHLKATLVIIGVLAAGAAMGSGGAVEDMFHDTPEKKMIVPIHAMWAGISITIFLVLAIAYAVFWIKHEMPHSFFEDRMLLKKIHAFLLRPSTFILDTPLSMILAGAGLIGITITGALGGAMVHGADVDPVVSFIYHLFF